ncbi:MAG TPA: DNA-processing protein DprA [Thermoanaerobaculia bacterium]|nr:DNA-processing protein DprA [Thermoanaerobaculia bacterium]
MSAAPVPIVRSPEEILGPLGEPEKLNAPARLYLAGDLGLLWGAPRVAVVGSRKPSENGRKRAAWLTRYLVSEGVTAVSGLSLGIDTVVHETALRELGCTIAVLGTPLEAYHPMANFELQRRIQERHLAVSQLPAGSPVQRESFIRRSFTMALLSDAAVIVQAGPASGSLQVGWEMLRLGRPVFLPRTVVETPGLEWPEAMLDRGARVIDDPASLLDAFLGPAAGRHDTRSSFTGYGEQDTFRLRRLKAG